MKKDSIKREYKNKIKLYKDYNRKYYDENISEISDSKYDELKKEILNLENKYHFLKSKESPSITVGYKPSKNFKKAFHKVPMLS